MATRRPAIRPIAAFIALLTVLGLGALYGATSALVPLIKLNAIILTLAAMAGFLTHAGLQRGLFTNLGVALVSAALGVAAMWGVWLGLEYPAELLSGLEKQGAQGVVELVTVLARTSTISLRGASGSVTTHGPDTVRMVWMAETAVMALSPVLGALWSPVARRRMAARAA